MGSKLPFVRFGVNVRFGLKADLRCSSHECRSIADRLGGYTYILYGKMIPHSQRQPDEEGVQGKVKRNTVRVPLVRPPVRGQNAAGHALPEPCNQGKAPLQVAWRALHRSKNRSRQAHLKHGRRTKEAIAAARERAERGRQLRAEIRDIEAWAVDEGLLKKTWRRDWR